MVDTAIISLRRELFVSNMASNTLFTNAISSGVNVVASCVNESEVVLTIAYVRVLVS